MSEDQDQPHPSDANKFPLSIERVKELIEIAQNLLNRLGSMEKIALSMAEGRVQDMERIEAGMTSISRGQGTVHNEIIPLLKQLSDEQDKLLSSHDKLRGVMLGKMEGLQGTMDIVRQDVRNAWRTADFAISNSRNTREESDKLLDLISTMQTQHQLLASQVEVLRRAAAEKDDGT